MCPQRIVRSASQTVAASLLLVAFGATVGCRIERAPSRLERSENHLAKLADEPLPILPQPERVDDLERIIDACGRPNADNVTPIYSKYYNGPVRRLDYVREREVTIDFIPTRPVAQLAYTEAPLPPSGNTYAELPPNASWRFQAGHMQEEYLITAHKLGVYLPCAGEALKGEY